MPHNSEKASHVSLTSASLIEPEEASVLHNVHTGCTGADAQRPASGEWRSIKETVEVSGGASCAEANLPAEKSEQAIRRPATSFRTCRREE